MAFEKRWDSLGPIAFTANGGQYGEISLLSTFGLAVGQEIILKSSTQQRVDLKVKRVLNETDIIVGSKSTGCTFVLD
jgi:hypothetical protein